MSVESTTLIKNPISWAKYTNSIANISMKRYCLVTLVILHFCSAKSQIKEPLDIGKEEISFNSKSKIIIRSDFKKYFN